jgi:uncharacterized membrane-anchored protein YhcB (DUF1043 family)
LSIAVVFVLKSRFRRQDHTVKAVTDTNRALELAPASLVLLFQNKARILNILAATAQELKKHYCNHLVDMLRA